MIIRRYESKDFDDVLYLHKLCYSEPCTENELREKLKNPSWVAVGSVVLGCLISDVGPMIWSLVTAPPLRKQGIASRLLDEAEQFYRGKELWLYAHTANPVVGLYIKRGYQIAETIKDFYGPSVDALKMKKVC